MVGKVRPEVDLDIATPLGQKVAPRIGLVTLANPFKDLETIRHHEQELVQNLQAFGAMPIVGDRLVMDRDSLMLVMAQLSQRNVHGLLVILGSYTSDTILLEIAGAYNGPLLMWAPFEQLSPELFPPFASLVGLTQSVGTLKRFGYRPYPFYGACDSPEMRDKLSRFLRAVSALETLRHVRIGRIGPGCPSMMDTQFDALLMRKQLGLEVVDFPIQTFIDMYRKAPDDQTAEIARQVQAMDTASTPAEADCQRSARAYHALRMLIAEHGLSAVTVRCWPELKEQDVVSPCLALSLLTDQGIPAGCEGDALGAASMLMAQLLTDRPAFFGDLVAVDSSSNEVLLFHCGAGAVGLAESPRGVRLRTHSRPVMFAPGVTVEFPVKPGEMTYLRLGQVERGFRLLLGDGIAVQHLSFCRGTTLRFRPRVGGRALLSGLMDAAAEHHLIVAQGDASQDAVALCNLWGVLPQTIT